MEVSELSNATSRTSMSSGLESDDFETFLRMLTTQIQNQDPLSPINSDDFSNQLATFSLVEQQTLTNQNLEKMLNQQEALGFLEYASLVGRTVAHSAGFEFSGEPIDFEIEPIQGNDSISVAIFDDQGRQVAELPVASGQTAMSWDGTASDGDYVSTGAFTAELVKQSDGAVIENAVSTAWTVREVRFASDEVRLELSDGTVLSYDEMTKIR